ncbi:phosphotransferase [Streptomyces sp. NPDC050504]|uniref:phosphotransferase n=1 Tax=Streptomyces sp. NPDC050504 TaxID=3365618 RepID=UPI00379F7DA5
MTTHATLPFTPSVRQLLHAHYEMPTDAAPERLAGGEESAAYRLGDAVVRIGGAGRDAADAEWCHAVATAAHRTVPEANAPLAARDGRTAIPADGLLVSVWPYVAGQWGDEEDPVHRAAAARVLARTHRALRAAPALGERPARRPARPDAPDVADPELDRWLAGFDAGPGAERQPVHGDFHVENVLLDPVGAVVAVLDWDEAHQGSALREAVHAAWEWGDCLYEGLEGAREFLAAYGTAVDDATLRGLVREHLRSEISYARAAHTRGAVLDAEQLAYTDDQVKAFHALRC